MDKPCENDKLLDEILYDYHILKEPQRLCFKGKIVLRIAGKELDVSGLSDGIEIAAKELDKLEYVKVFASGFMTVENRASYLRYSDEDMVVFYLGGYANRFQRDFIKKVFMFNTNILYMHFGDIDAGGFRIHRNLCDITGIDFGLFHMSADELKNKAYEACLHRLTDNDVSRLNELQKIPEYADTISYMLKHSVKLEQEIVSLSLMNN